MVGTARSDSSRLALLSAPPPMPATPQLTPNAHPRAACGVDPDAFTQLLPAAWTVVTGKNAVAVLSHLLRPGGNVGKPVTSPALQRRA